MVFVVMRRYCLSCRKPCRFGVPWTAFCVAALCFAAFPSSAEAQNTPGIKLLKSDGTTLSNMNPLLVYEKPSDSNRAYTRSEYTVSLTTNPNADVTVSVTWSANSFIKLKAPGSSTFGTSATLTFTTTNWSTAQTVKVEAESDTNTRDETTVLTHTASSTNNNYDGVTAEFTAVTLDIVEGPSNELWKNQGIRLTDLNGLPLNKLSVEEGKTKKYRVSMKYSPYIQYRYIPDVDVVVNLTPITELGVTVNPSSLTFTKAQFSDWQKGPEQYSSTVTVTAGEDNDFDNETVTFTHTAQCPNSSHDTSGNCKLHGKNETLNVTVVDNDRTFVLGTLTNDKVNEDNTGDYTVRLNRQPSASVTVAVARTSGDADLSVQSGGSLTFTTTDWDRAQTVTLAAAEDDDYLNGSAVFTHTATGGGWDGTSATKTVSENDNDKNKRKPTLPSSPVWVPEEGTLAVPVILSIQPSASDTVTVTVTKTTNHPFFGGIGSCIVYPDPPVNEPHDNDLTVVAPSTLTFTSTNWNTPQTVTLSAADDTDSDDDCDAFKFTASGYSNDPNHLNDSNVYPDTKLVAFESDNDVTGRALVLSPTSVSVPEGSTASYTVKLASAPTASVTVAVAKKTTGTQDTDLTVSPSSLTFTTTTWDTAQTVTLSAAEDTDAVNGTAVITHIPAGKWRSAAVELTATEVDKDYVPPESEPVTFGTRTIEDQRFVKDFSIAALTLPAATGGSGITYTLSGPLPAGLTFDPATRVLSGTPTELQGAVPHTYTATEGDTTVTLTFTIAVDEDTAPEFVDPQTLAPLQIPNQTYVVNEAITALTLPEATGGNPPITYTLAEAGAGPQGRTRAATDTGNQGAVLTLPAGLTFDPETRVLSGEPTVLQQPRTYLYTASDYNGSRATMEFTIAVEEEKVPTFGDQTIAPQTYVQDTAIRPLALPVATGGNGRLTYALSAIPAGLTFDSATRVLAGTPTEVQPATRYTYTVTDEDGDPAPEELTVTITILSAAEKQILKDVLAAQGRALLSSATGVIGQRFRLPGMTSGGVLGACTGTSAPSEAPPAEAGQEEGGEVPRGDRASECLSGILDAVAHGLAGVRGGGGVGDDAVAEPWRSRGPDVTRMGAQPAWNWESLIWGQSFALPLSGSGTEAGPSAWTLWGAGDVQGFNGTPRQGQYDGQMYSLYLGLDKRWAERWLAGAAVARSWGTTDYEAGGGGSAGQVETSLTSVYPYVRGAFESGLEVWAIGGYGRGEAENTRRGVGDSPGGATGASASASSDLRMFLGATGARQPMTEYGGVQLALVGGAGYVTLATDEGAPLLGNLDVAVQRARLAVEATWATGGLAPYVQVGGRYDGGDGQTGAGLETVAGLRYTSERVEFEARGRWLAAHAAEGYEEYGGLARLAVKPRADGTGWQMDVAPRWGAAQGAGLLGGGEALLGGGAVPGMGVNRLPSATTRVLSVESELGYGFGVLDGYGVLTPYGGFALTGEETRRYRVGGRLGVARWLNVSLEGTRQEGTGPQPANQGVQVKLEGRF